MCWLYPATHPLCGFCSCEAASGVLHPALAFPAQERHGPFAAGQGKGHRNYQWAPMSLEKRRHWGDHIAAFQYIKEAYKKDGDRHLPGPVAAEQGATVLNWKRLCLNWIQGRNFLLWGGWDTETGCPEKLWMCHYWKCSKSCWWSFGQADLVKDVAAHGRGLDYVILKGPSDPSNSMVLCCCLAKQFYKCLSWIQWTWRLYVLENCVYAISLDRYASTIIHINVGN